MNRYSYSFERMTKLLATKALIFDRSKRIHKETTALISILTLYGPNYYFFRRFSGHNLR